MTKTMKDVIIETLRESGPLTAAELCLAMGGKMPSIRVALCEMSKTGAVIQSDGNYRRKYRAYDLEHVS